VARAERELYASPNGDRWLLVRDGQRVAIRHEPNPASGGAASERNVGEFLVQSGQGPEKQELLRLIGTLADDGPAPASESPDPSAFPRTGDR
jgi:hypothetical protein